MRKLLGLLVAAAVAVAGVYAVICYAGDKTSEKPLDESVENDKQAIMTSDTQTVSTPAPTPPCMKPPYKVALIVQNHTSDAPTLPMAAFADTLTSRLSGKTFRLVNPTIRIWQVSLRHLSRNLQVRMSGRETI